MKRMHVNAFPAVHLKKMDWYDYALKFSSEAVVLALVLLVGGLNLMFFGIGNSKMFSDNSHAAKFLTYHSSINPKLYAKETSVNTVIVTPKGFISQASAENLPSLQSALADSDAASQDEVILSDDGMVKPNPDSISGLIAKQIKIYQTQDGDTLASVAAKFAISQQTIMWANNLASTSIKPGWQLVILPTDGILYKANSNDTIPDIAKKYASNTDTIVSYNALDNAEDIEPGQIFIIPGGRIPEPPKPIPAPRSNGGKVNGNGVVTPREYDEGTGHLFPWGYCTWYVATKVHVPWGGNAKNWLANAKAYGAVVSSKPAPGAIVVTNDSAKYGHVAYVESVDDDGFTVSEMNYEKFGKVDTRWISKNSSTIKGFIYP